MRSPLFIAKLISSGLVDTMKKLNQPAVRSQVISESLENRRLLSATLTPTFTNSIPSNWISGQKSKDAIAITVTNTGDATYKSGAKVSIYAASAQATNADEVIVRTITLTGSIAAGATRAVTIPVKLIPANLVAGNYFLDARITEGGIADADVFSNTQVNVAAPFVDLTPRLSGISRPHAHDPSYIIARMYVDNIGNVLAKGTLSVQIEFSIYSDGASPRAFKTVSKAINIPAGGTKTFMLAGSTKSYPHFEYHMVDIINSNHKIIESDYSNDEKIYGGYFSLPTG